MFVFKQQTVKIERVINHLWHLLKSQRVGVDDGSLSHGHLLARAEFGN